MNDVWVFVYFDFIRLKKGFEIGYIIIECVIIILLESILILICLVKVNGFLY